MAKPALTPDVVESTALVPTTPAATPLPVFRGDEMTTALKAYRDLQAALDRAMPDQIMTLDGKPFRKKGFWKAIAVAFNLSVELVDERREVYGALESGGDNYGYLVTYRASTPSGRAATGDGTCTASEKQRGRMKATEHNVRSHAHTRACNRAISNLVAFGEVSAEEIDREANGNGYPVAASKPAAVTRGLVKPSGLDDWLDDMISKADEGTAELERAWMASSREYRRYLTIMQPDVWESIKTKAANVPVPGAA
jgi:hypothetical protein